MNTSQLKIKTKQNETSKVKIKVLKKLAVTICSKPVVIEKNLNQAATREIVSTVSSWINEFQEQRRQETKQALNLYNSKITF